jgi:hypothetical protein
MGRLAELQFARSKHKLFRMPRIGFQFAALLASLVQSAAVMPLRTGEVARQLTEQDLAALEMGLQPGEKPWLLNGDRSQLGSGQYIQAFLPPTVSTPVLRRGKVIVVYRRNARNMFERPEPTDPWVVERTESYAQVAIAGRNFDQIQGDQAEDVLKDINRPFRVIGRFDDSELVQAVQSLRSDPAPMPWPIMSIERQMDDSMTVMLRKTAWDGQIVILRQAGQNWIVMPVGWWAY